MQYYFLPLLVWIWPFQWANKVIAGQRRTELRNMRFALLDCAHFFLLVRSWCCHPASGTCLAEVVCSFCICSFMAITKQSCASHWSPWVVGERRGSRWGWLLLCLHDVGSRILPYCSGALLKAPLHVNRNYIPVQQVLHPGPFLWVSAVCCRNSVIVASHLGSKWQQEPGSNLQRFPASTLWFS